MTKDRHTASLFDPLEQAEPCSNTIEVAFESAADSTFTYQVPDDLVGIRPGQRVEVPFGKANRLHTGFCVSTHAGRPVQPGYVLKKVRAWVDPEPLLDEPLLGLARWISEYYFCPLGQVLAAMVPGPVKRAAGIKTSRFAFLAREGGTPSETPARASSEKQKQILDLLRARQALSADTAEAVSRVLEECRCTELPVKALVRKGLVRITTRQTWSSAADLPLLGEPMGHGPVVLNADQEQALNHVHQQVQRGVFGVSVLHGVTDSGKTEVYIRAIEQTVRLGKRAIVLVPEIALTGQTVQRFRARFDRVAVLHSALTPAQRNAQWQFVRSGQVQVVVGPRSAVFAPLPNLGLIVVDEEHESSYKQDTAPRYHGRDVAIKRAQIAGAHCLLGSATPCLETLSNCRAGRFTLLRMPKRVMDLPMPSMRLVDLQQEPLVRAGKTLLSEALVRHLGEVLERKEQAILLLNRRGYSHFVFCPSCKYMLKCRNCDVNLTFHKTEAQVADLATVVGKPFRRGVAVCHYCMAQTLVPQACPLCAKGMALIGLGSQRLEEDLTRQFPLATVARLDSDSAAGPGIDKILRAFGAGRIDILAGTQMLAKGLHFPNVTLVGIISADTSLYLPDFRANERTVQLISQVAGRAGRSAKGGTVIIQTYLPHQPAIQFALKNDFDGFVQEELKCRQVCLLPPFGRMALIGLRDMRYERLEAAAKAVKERLDLIVAADALPVKVRGPMPATISRIQRFHRMQVIVQSGTVAALQKVLGSFRRQSPIRPAVTITVDVDPMNLL